MIEAVGFFNSPIFASEYRVGLSMHDMERRIEGGAALSIEKIFDQPSWWHEYAGRPHLGTQISLANNTHLFYFGSSWNLFQKGKFSGELAFGGAIHTGNEEIKNGELGYGCKANFRELIAFAYDITDKHLYNMKTLFTITLIGTAMYFLLPYIIVASILMFDGFLFGHIIDTALAPSPQQ